MPYPQPKKKLKDKEDVRAWIRDVFKNAAAHLQLDGYNISFCLDGELGSAEKEKDGSTLSIDINFPYRHIYLTIHQRFIENSLKADTKNPWWITAEQLVIHESVHVVLWHLVHVAQKRYTTSSEIEEAEESAVDHISIVIQSILQDLREARNKKK